MAWFTTEGEAWTPASTRLIPVRLISAGVPIGIIAALLAAVGASAGGGAWIPLIVWALFAAWAAWIIVRQVTAHGWLERKDDLLVRRGRLFRRVTVVPYGRMQYVEVSSGPLLRAFGLARVQLHTASPGTDAHLAGVPASIAAELRDRLTARGEARLAGL